MGTVAAIFAALSALFVAVGAAFVVAGTRTGRAARRFDAKAVRVNGLVVDVLLRRGTRSASDGDSGMWVPVLEFTTMEGRRVRTEAMYGSVPAPARSGEEVAILYDPDQPERARVADRVLASGGCISGALVALGALAVAVGVLAAAGALLALTRL
jgi:Protein of unknown function (DUF3592)